MSFPFRVGSLADFSEEVKAVAMAKCSRSKNTFREDAEALVTSGNAGGVYNKIVIGYGHESPADMAMLSTTFEDISTLAAEQILDIQTGKFQGKSSRYVVFGRDRVVDPFTSRMTGGQLSIDEHGAAWEARRLYDLTISRLFDAYEGLYTPVESWVLQQPGWADEKPDAVRGRVLDALRYLLPFGALTNLGTRLSARDTAELVRILQASPLAEFQDLATATRAQVEQEVPSLLKYTDPNPLYADVNHVYRQLRGHGDLTYHHGDEPCEGVKLVEVVDFESEVVCVAILEATGGRWDMPYSRLARVLGQDPAQPLVDYMAKRQRRQDPVPHAYRAARLRYALTTDLGSYKDLRRHRRQELFDGPLHFRGGYAISEDVAAIGGAVLAEYTAAMAFARATYLELVNRWPEFIDSAQYAVPHGAHQTWSLDMDLQQLVYLAELRTAPGGHISYRRIAAEMMRQAKEYFPNLLKHTLVHPVDGVAAHH